MKLTPNRFTVDSRPLGLPALLVIIICWGVVGATLVAGALVQGWGPQPSLIGIPDAGEGISGAFILAAGVCLVLAAREWRHPDSRWRLELVGCALAVGGWGAYLIMCAANQPLWMVPWWEMGSGFAAASAVRFVQVWRHARSVRSEGIG